MIHASAADENIYVFKGRKIYVYWHHKNQFGTCQQICYGWTETLGPVKNDVLLWAFVATYWDYET